MEQQQQLTREQFEEIRATSICRRRVTIDALDGGWVVTGINTYVSHDFETPIAQEQRVRIVTDYDDAGADATAWLSRGEFPK